ncbi:hypothetical protein CVT24_012287 [Panaeolus cyanescens]|uniref:Uncharacterized protein n=1 Tax=Panaeolus cyanescens TaxID=181874 RepID=A0A409YJ44_9AGAR|nr:hypothetical protein CVT24_012287 [Panaeolus cyanescens]
MAITSITTSSSSFKPVVVVLNTPSPDLVFEGDWDTTSPTSDMLDPTVFTSRPFSESLKSVPDGKVGSVFYNFTGITDITLYGTVNSSALSALDRNNPDNPTIMGFGVSCDLSPYTGPGREAINGLGLDDYGISNNSVVLCYATDLLPEVQYSLNMTIEPLSTRDGNGTRRTESVWFDAITVAPAREEQLGVERLVRLDHRHPSIEYDENWESFSSRHVANVGASSAAMSVEFYGTSLTWFTSWQKPMGMISAGAQVIWSIDNKNPQLIPLDMPPRFENVSVEEPLFTTGTLDKGVHRLDVRYYSNFETTLPLTLASLEVENYAVVGSSGWDGGNRDGSGREIKVKIGAGIAGGMLLVLLSLSLFLFYRYRCPRRHRLKRRIPEEGENIDEPRTSDISPFFQHNPRPPVDKGVSGSSQASTLSTVYRVHLQDGDPPPYLDIIPPTTVPSSTPSSQRSK